MRVDFVKSVSEIIAEDENSIFVTGDLGYAALETLAANHPRRFLNAGVAEQNMMGVAAGMALTGLRPWVYSIAPFTTYRCLEQIRNDVCLHKLPVRIAGNGGGYTYGIMGSTHHALEDLAVLRPLPNIQLFFPCANDHVAAAVRAMSTLSGPAYIRLAISAFSTQWSHLDENPLTLTRRYSRQASPSVTVIGVGHGVQIALRALATTGLAHENVDVFGVARFPLDLKSDAALCESVAASRRVLVVDEHYLSGSVGEALRLALPRARHFEVMAASYSPEQRYGNPEFHLRQCGLTPEALSALVGDLQTRPA
ncbi:MAG TPA: transketolase C-terminal domain-containing protein [Polyangiaceae bacterium]|nr:transketolase C-terminal domain-containing protein [Polyangiaceae bacterium]